METYLFRNKKQSKTHIKQINKWKKLQPAHKEGTSWSNTYQIYLMLLKSFYSLDDIIFVRPVSNKTIATKITL